MRLLLEHENSKDQVIRFVRDKLDDSLDLMIGHCAIGYINSENILYLSRECAETCGVTVKMLDKDDD